MSQSHIAGWTPESPTPAQLAEFFRQIKSGRMTKSRLQKILGGLFVTVDPSLSWDAMVKAGGYDSVYVDPGFDPALHLPAFPAGQEEAEVILRKHEVTTTTSEWLNILDDDVASQEIFIHPFTALAIGASEDYRDKQRETPIFVIWRDSTGQLWYLVLREVGSGRILVVDRAYPDDEWDVLYCAGVARKLSPSA